MGNNPISAFQIETAKCLDRHTEEYACLARKALHMASQATYESLQIFWIGEHEKWKRESAEAALKAARIRETTICFNQHETSS